MFLLIISLFTFYNILNVTRCVWLACPVCMWHVYVDKTFRMKQLAGGTHAPASLPRPLFWTPSYLGTIILYYTHISQYQNGLADLMHYSFLCQSTAGCRREWVGR